MRTIQEKRDRYESVYTSVELNEVYILKGIELKRICDAEIYRIIDAIPVSIFWKDVEGVYLGCNRYMLDLAGLSSREQIIGKTDYDFLETSFADKTCAIDRSVLEKNMVFEAEESIFLKHTRENKFFYSAKKILLNDFSMPLGIIGASIDVTEKINLRNLIRLEKEKTLEAQTISGTVAHDIKNQTMVISLLAEKELQELEMAFKNGEISEIFYLKMKANKEKILTQTQKIYQNIDDSTEYFQEQIIEEQKASEKFEIHPISTTTLPLEEYLRTKGKIELLVFQNAKEFSYQGNPIWVEKILTNLTHNALREIEKKGKGQIFINTSSHEHFNILHFKDTAGGITQDLINKIFDLYKTAKVQNTGLGLSSAQIYMKKMNATLTAHLVDGDCIEFQLKFPKLY